MKVLTLVAALLISASSFAANFSFTYFGNEGGRQSYYACDYVQYQTEDYLQLLGATNIDVSCSGGIQSNWNVQPVSIRAKFDLPVVTGSVVDTVELQGDAFNPACGINVQIISEILKKMTNVSVVKKKDSCAFATTNYYYKLNVAR